VRARGRKERFLDSKRLFEKVVALGCVGTVAGELGRCDGGTDVIEFISGCKWTIKRNLDHDRIKVFLRYSLTRKAICEKNVWRPQFANQVFARCAALDSY
jgi:hypothetical protein